MSQDNVYTRITLQKAAELDTGTPLSAGQHPKFVVNLSKSIQGVTSEELGEAVTRTEAAANKAATSEKNAKTSETAAKNSQTAAATSQSEAKKSQDAAKTSENNAKSSETAAKSSQTAAASSQAAAKTSETNAKASETASKNSQTAAAASQSAAKTSETNAKTSETNAKNSETNAKTSQTEAKKSQDAALASQVAAKKSEDNINATTANLVSKGDDGFHGGTSAVRWNNEQEFLNAARDQKISSRIFRNDQTTNIDGVSRYAPSFLFKAGDTWANLSIDYTTGRLRTRAGNSSGGTTTPSRSYLFNDEVWTRKEADDRFLPLVYANTRGVPMRESYGNTTTSTGWVCIAEIGNGNQDNSQNGRYLFNVVSTTQGYGSDSTTNSYMTIAVTILNGRKPATNFAANAFNFGGERLVRIKQVNAFKAEIWVSVESYSKIVTSCVTANPIVFKQNIMVNDLPVGGTGEATTYDAQVHYRMADRDWVHTNFLSKTGANHGLNGEFIWDQKTPQTYSQYINNTSVEPNEVNYIRRWRNYRNGTLWHEVAEAGGLAYYHGGTPVNFISRLNSGGHLTLRNGLTIQDVISSGGGIRTEVLSGSWASFSTRGAGIQVAATHNNGASSIFKLIDKGTANTLVVLDGYSPTGKSEDTLARLRVGTSEFFVDNTSWRFNKPIHVDGRPLVISGGSGFALGHNQTEAVASGYVADFDDPNTRSGPYRVHQNSKGTRPVGFTGGFHIDILVFGNNYVAQTATLFSNGGGKSYRRTYNPATKVWSTWMGISMDGEFGWGGIGKSINLSEPDYIPFLKKRGQVSEVFRNDADPGANLYHYKYGTVAYFKAGDTYTAITAAHNGAGVKVFGGNWQTWYDYNLYHQRNTTVDSNGFIKKASPIVKLYSDKIELNEESEGVTLIRLGVGHYIVRGVLGFNSDGAWGVNGGVVIPKDENDQPILWVKTKILKDGDIEVKTYHRQHAESPEMFQNYRIKEVIDSTPVYYEDGEVVDIPDNTWIDLRVEMPEDSIYNLKRVKQEKEMEEQIKLEKRKEVLSSIVDAQNYWLTNDTFELHK